MKEELYNKIDKFCNETDWSKYPTYEHALEDFIKGIVAEEIKEFEKENAELRNRNQELLQSCEGATMMYKDLQKTNEQLSKAKELLKRWINSYGGVDICLCNKSQNFIDGRKMTEEEYFRKTYPDSCYGDRPLSPHFDFFQDGVEFGERESEEKIAELELQLEREKKLNLCLSDDNEQLREQIKRMKCCYNCEHGQNECYCSIKHSDICDLSCWDCGCDKWEIKENG